MPSKYGACAAQRSAFTRKDHQHMPTSTSHAHRLNDSHRGTVLLTILQCLAPRCTAFEFAR
eukprot:5016619-Alexandrium_andersonii.AAC.1